MMNWLTGFHAVEEALAAGRALDRIVIARGRHGERVEAVVQLARSKSVPVRFEERSQIDRLAGTREHQGIAALAAAKPALELEDLLAAKTPQGLLVLLDGIEDPHNLGAIVRTALAAGAHGVVIPERRAVGLTDTVERASAGALAHLPVARVKNLVRAMEEMKEAGYWLIGLDERAEKKYTEADFSGQVGIVLGSEGEGLHELTRKRCDFLVSIPTTGPVRALNVSVAAGVVLFEVVRQRSGKKSEKAK
ncbi:MAG: 23S rRNA (guanosine(2251)-2'-O)-methyltransferase RlmB [Candidatus Acidiferrales bacterium]